jgi:Fe-S cluster biogenesis protein NfuA
MNQPLSITLEFTPNPNTLKFVVNSQLIERGAANFTTLEKTAHSPLAKKIFGIEGIQGVMIGTNFVTITKSPAGNWDTLAEQVPSAIESHLKSGEPIFDTGYVSETPTSMGDSLVEKRIQEVLDNEIRPAVAMDGGDITFDKYVDGVVFLHLQGSCSSCPSSVATLKMGVESRLKEVIPEIKEVVQV